jgi:uncharacterized protein (DUF927 family)
MFDITPLTPEEKQDIPVAPAEPEGTLLCPVPPETGQPPVCCKHRGEPEAVYTYRDAQGNVLCHIARYVSIEKGKREKHFRPFTCYRMPDGTLRWKPKALPAPRPLYGLEQLATYPAATVILTEGEKACEAARQLCPDYVVLCAPNGTQSANKADLSPLKGRKVIIAPDADEPGAQYAITLQRLLLQQGATGVGIMPLPEQVRIGWDFADALAEGWKPEDAARLLQDTKIRHQEPHIPPEYVVRDDGVYFDPDPENGEKPLQRIASRIDVIALTCDENNENWGRLVTWKDADGHRHCMAIPMEMFKGDAQELRGYLLSKGLEISHKHRQKLSDYIQRTNPHRKAKSISKTGWHQHHFALPDAVFPASNDMHLQNSYLGYTAFNTCGTLEGWQQQIGRYIPGNSRLVLAACVAFAAPLLRIINAESGLFHLRGGSSIGKSTALSVSASIWGGDPDNGYIRQWRSTANALEATAVAHNDCLLCLDEMGQIDGKEAGEVAYMLANESGKSRMSKDITLRKPLTWKLYALSTGEVSLQEKLREAQKRTYAGMETRFVDILADVGKGHGLFDTTHDLANGNALSTHLREASQQYYGTPIRAFLDCLTQQKRAVVSESIMQQVQNFTTDHTPAKADGQVQRVCQRFGLLMAAGMLASGYGVLPVPPDAIREGIRDCFLSWLEQRGTYGNLEVHKAVSHIRAWFMKHAQSRFAVIYTEQPSGSLTLVSDLSLVSACPWY